jgi:DNA-binding NtrC family response regulator
LAEAVKTGQFREDLYYRLNVFPIEIPALRDRAEDISALLDHFIKRFNAQERRNIRGVNSQTLDMLKNFDWPGNVRQLENAVFRAVILSDGHMLQPQDFPQISGLNPIIPAQETVALSTLDDTQMDDETKFDIIDRDGHLRSLQDIERDLIQFAIDNYSGHMSEVARRLGIGRSTLYRKVREHDLNVDIKSAASK